MQKLDPKQGYIVAVSGGPDSVYLMTEIAKQKLPKILIAHVNYHYRKDSDHDQEIVESLAKKYELPYRILNIEPDIYQTKIGNFESWARKIRYGFFATLAKENKYKNILIAHNHNDSIETFIMQSSRNNIVNRYGLSPKIDFQGLTVIRPMLNINKSAIITKLNEKKIPYAIDTTNFDQKYIRNKIRAELDEADFPDYDEKIKQQNQLVFREIVRAQKYLDKHYTTTEFPTLAINESWAKLPPTTKKRVIYLFLHNHQQSTVIDRKRQLINEVIRRLDESQKQTWQIKLSDITLLKDYQNLRLIPTKLVSPHEEIINCDDDLYHIEEFPNAMELLEAMKRDGFHFPYIISNDYGELKNNLKRDSESLETYDNKHQIPYFRRYTNGFIRRRNSQKVLA